MRYRPMVFELETARLELRLRDAEDAPTNLALLRAHTGGTTRTLAEVRERLVAQRAEASAAGFGLLSIRLKATGERIGYCGLIIGRATHDEPEIAYELLERHHGNGYATEAAVAVVDAALATGRTRVWSTVGAWNAPSLRVLEKAGFRRDRVEGVLVWMVTEGVGR